MKENMTAILAVVVVVLLQGCKAAETTYSVGDTGPAGGIIFYVDESGSFDWTYLEVAPDASQGYKAWGKQDTAVGGTQIAIGTGRANTELIVLRMSEDPADPDSAAIIADGLSSGGYSDWFLPSRDELVLLYENLYTEGLSSFNISYYWSSSESDAANSFALFFDSSRTPEAIAKNNGGHVRAIRAFK